MPTSLPPEFDEARELDFAMLIADLSGYTAFTETHGALHASEIVLRFQRLAPASLEPGVAIINSIGDDVFCAPINLTARVAAHAVGGQILCTEPIARAVRGIAEIEVRTIGERRFRNVARSVAVFELARVSAAARISVIDPVCRMQVEIARAVATIAHAGATYHFCSLKCAGDFANAPAIRWYGMRPGLATHQAGALERISAPSCSAAGSGCDAERSTAALWSECLAPGSRGWHAFCSYVVTGRVKQISFHACRFSH